MLKMVRIFIWKVLRKLALSFDKLSKIVKPRIETRDDIQYRRCQPWFKDNGDRTHRLNYDLSSESVVFDLGGYEGQWASDIYSKYGCLLFIFEPHSMYADNIRYRFSNNNRIKVFSFGLAHCDQTLKLYLSKDESSVFNRKGSSAVDIILRRADVFLNELGIKGIDLMKINIEGGEYDLLEHLIKAGYVTKIKNLQIQFHDFVPNARSRMEIIQNQLARTHYLTYQYEFVWENWTRR